jgi:hypothetical protein
MEIPKKIWTYWSQGFDGVPELVKKCISSWENANPEWEIYKLDDTSISQYVDLLEDLGCHKIKQLTTQKKANLIRLKLLIKHGGVWADATCFCNKPLDEWIPEAAPGGLFMFSNPGRDRLISNWFIAAAKNNHLLETLYKHQVNYWLSHDFQLNSNYNKRLTRFLGRFINRNLSWPLIWFHPLFTKGLKISPYMIFHYSFFAVIKKDEESWNIWNAMVKIDADGPHRIQRIGMGAKLTAQCKFEIDHSIAPVFKLSYKGNMPIEEEGTIVHYLFNKDPKLSHCN